MAPALGMVEIKDLLPSLAKISNKVRPFPIHLLAKPRPPVLSELKADR